MNNPTRVQLGPVALDSLTMPEALERLHAFTSDGRTHYVCFCEASILSNVERDPELAAALARADLCVADGIAAIWLGRIHRHAFPERIQGPRFMLEACRESVARGYSHYFYGGTPDTLAALTANLSGQFPGLKIAGTRSPPFRDLTPGEEAAERAVIEAAKPDLVWVALGSPRQEKWAARQAAVINAPVLLAVGAAFDFHAGSRPWAPRWVRATGMEWLFRMATGGRRTLRRNARCVPVVAGLLIREFCRKRR